jgi:hypothetical protein
MLSIHEPCAPDSSEEDAQIGDDLGNCSVLGIVAENSCRQVTDYASQTL